MPVDMTRTTAGIAVVLMLLVGTLLFGCRPPGENIDAQETDTHRTDKTVPPLQTSHLLIDPLTIYETPEAQGTENGAVSVIAEERESTVIEQSGSPRIAIIIDDMGFHRHLGDQLIRLDLDLTYSFLPHAPFTPDQARAAHRAGRDILVHLPMEPKDPFWDPGPGALVVGDGPELIRKKTEQMLAAVPHAIGANNHMGSRFTEEETAMRTVIVTLQQHSLFFIDSFTSIDSRGLEAARWLGLPSARRHIFLDNDQDPDTILRQLAQLIALAHQQGEAIGIGHPYPATLTALHRCRETLCREIEIVGVHQLVR
jgi:uncharacterized protein